MRHALAYVAGFGAVFTLLGITATFAAGPLVDYLPALRTIGGLVLIVLGLNLAGHPPHPGPRAQLAAARCRRRGLAGDRDRHDLFGSGAAGRASVTGSAADRRARAAAGWRRSVSGRSSPSAGRPCIGIILGGILTMAATSGTVLQGTILLIAYTIGLGLAVPVIAAVYDRAPRLLRAARPPRPRGVADRRPAGRRSSASRWSSTGWPSCRATSTSTRPSE